MPSLATAVLVATAALMSLAVAMPFVFYGGLRDPGLPVEWLQAVSVAGAAFALSGAMALGPVFRWSRGRTRPRPRLGIVLAALLWALLAALVFTAVLTLLGSREAADRMGTAPWPALGRALLSFEWAALTVVLFFPLTICCLLGGLGYAWSRAATGRI